MVCAYSNLSQDIRLIVTYPGVTKTYRLTYESATVQRAVFSKDGAKNHWSIRAHVLKSFGEYFGAKAEQLDIYYEAGRITFTSYTEKVMNGNGRTSAQFPLGTLTDGG